MSKYYKDHYDVIIIGASLAGLGSALQLLPKGYDVLVLEQHNLPGGVATSFVRSGVEIEASLHEMMSIGEPECPLKIRQFLEESGVNVDWIRVPIAYRYVAPGIDVVIHAGKNGDFSVPSRDLASIVKDPKEREKTYKKLMKFFKLCLHVYDSQNEVSVNPVSKLEMIFKHNDFVRTIGYTTKEVLRTFKFPKNVEDVLQAYWMYIGTPISDAPFSVQAFLYADYMGYGSYIPKKTSHEMALKMLEAATSKGAQVEFNQRVDKILVENNKVKGVRLADGTEISSDYVICGAYPSQVYSKMIEPLSEVPEAAIKWVNAMELGVSCFSVVMLLDKDYKELGFEHYSTFYAPNGMDSDKFYKNGKDYMHWDYLTTICTNVAHEDASPKGTCIYSITYLPDGQSFNKATPEEYQKYKDELTEYFIEEESKRLGINLREHILDIIIETPISISHYTGAFMGTIYGYRHTMSNHAVARTQLEEHEKFISGLYFAGSHQVAGDGMAPAITNGRKAAKQVLDEDKKRKAGK